MHDAQQWLDGIIEDIPNIRKEMLDDCRTMKTYGKAKQYARQFQIDFEGNYKATAEEQAQSLFNSLIEDVVTELNRESDRGEIKHDWGNKASRIVDQLQDEKKEQAKKDNASVYERLSKVDVSKFVDKKNGLNYLSWAKAWGLVKSIFPDASYKLREYPYYTQTADGNYQQIGTHDYLRTEYGVEVEASVTIKGETYSSKLYVMDFHNRALDPKKVTYFEINKTQMRALTKALAFAGLGLNIYAGEDLPSNDEKTPQRTGNRYCRSWK